MCCVAKPPTLDPMTQEMFNFSILATEQHCYHSADVSRKKNFYSDLCSSIWGFSEIEKNRIKVATARILRRKKYDLNGSGF